MALSIQDTVSGYEFLFHAFLRIAVADTAMVFINCHTPLLYILQVEASSQAKMEFTMILSLFAVHGFAMSLPSSVCMTNGIDLQAGESMVTAK